VTRLSPRTKAILSLAAAAILPVAFAISSPGGGVPLPTESERLSQLAGKAMEGGGSLAWLLLTVAILVCVAIWRRERRASPPFLEITSAPCSTPRVALLTFTWVVGQAVAGLLVGMPYSASGKAADVQSFALTIALVWALGTVLGLFVPLWLLVQGRLPEAQRLGIRLPQRGKEFVWGFLAFLTFPALVFIGISLTSLIRKFNPLETNPVFAGALSSTSPAEWILLFVVVCVLGPVVEEFLFRGLLYRSLRDLWKPLPAMAIGGVFFSVIHPSIMTLLPLAFLGMVLAYLYERTSSLVPGMVAHGLYNTSTLAAVFWLQHVAA
jgi:membrane protease YdiL (CAAX protease family)